MTQHWINTISLDHVELAVAGSFTQAGHGNDTGLRKLQRGDDMVFYSPRTTMRSGDPVQRFTALGTIADDEPYQVEVSGTFHPWRRRVIFEATGQADVHPLVDELTFIVDPQRWGFPFRRGLFEVSSDDFDRIARAMRSS